MTQQARQQQRQQIKQRLKELLKARPQKQKLQENSMTRPQKQLWLVAMSRVKEAMTMLAEQKGDFGLLYLTDALEIVESIRGPYHGETAKLHVALGGTLQALEKYPRAKQSYQKAIEIYHVFNDSREKNQDQGGHNIYSKRYIQAWIGLGTTNSHQEKWNEAMKAFQSAARLELYNLVVGMMTSKNHQSGQPESPQSLTLQYENLLSVRHLRALIHSIETNHANNRKQVWSKFPHLPKDISLYLDALQTTVQHEVRGDLLYQRGQFEAAQREYQVALAMFQQQVHTAKQSGISWNAIWLLRKQALAELNVVAGNGDKKHLGIPPLNHLVEPGFPPHCPGLDKACQALVDADAMLRDAQFDHEQLLRAFYRLEEARVLAKLYHTTAPATMLGSSDGPVPTTVPQPQQQRPPLSSQSIVEDMKRTLEELRQQLVPEGLSPPSEPRRPINTQLVWQDLQHLSILVEAQESLLATTPRTAGSQPPLLAESSHPSIPSPFPVEVCHAGPGILHVHPTDPVLEPGMWFVTALVLALLLVAPMLLLRNKMVGPVHIQDKEKKEQNQNKVIPTDHGAKMSLDQQVPVASDPSEETSQPDTIHVIPALTLKESTSTTTGTGSDSNSSGKAILMLQCLDRLEAELQGMSFPLNSSREFMANKVSALVCLHKTRQALLAQVMGEVEDDDNDNNITLDDNDDDDRHSVDINQSGLPTEMEFHSFLHRMQELGFESLVADWLNM